jgi:hypothetical protein
MLLCRLKTNGPIRHLFAVREPTHDGTPRLCKKARHVTSSKPEYLNHIRRPVTNSGLGETAFSLNAGDPAFASYD